MFDDLPLFRAADPTTSRDGAKDVLPRRDSQQHQLLAAYLAGDATDEEAGVRSGLAAKPRCCYWKRCSEMRAKGWLEPTGEVRLSTAGSAMQVCRLTSEGRRVLEALR